MQTPPELKTIRIPLLHAVLRLAMVLLAMTPGFSCSKREKPERAIVVKFPKPDPAKARPGPPMEVGTITSVNQKAGFVLIETNGFAAPAEGVTLKSMRAGVEVGVIKVSAERRHAFFTADIVSGSPQRGDKALQ